MLLREKRCAPFVQYHSLRLIFVGLARWASWRKVWMFLELVVGRWGVEGAETVYHVWCPGEWLHRCRWGSVGRTEQGRDRGR